MKKWVSFLNISTIIGGILVVCMTGIILADVFMRYVFNSPIQGAMEYCALIMSWVAYIAIGYALCKGAHMQMTAFFEKYSPRHKCIASIIYNALGALMFAIVTFYSFRAAWTSFVTKEQMSSARVVYYYFGKFAVPVGACIYTITAIFMIAQNAKKLFDLKKSGEVSKEEMEK